MASEEVLRTYERLLTGAVDLGDGSGEEYAVTIANTDTAHGTMLRVMVPDTLRPMFSLDNDARRLTLTNDDGSQTVFVRDGGFWRVQRHSLPSGEAI